MYVLCVVMLGFIFFFFFFFQAEDGIRDLTVTGVQTCALPISGYSLARLVGRWGERMGMGIFFTYLIPPTLLFVPFSRLISLLGLQDSLGALILIYPTMTIPFCTWLVMGFLRSVPWEIEEQAMIDGYSRLAVILKVGSEEHTSELQSQS